MSWSIWSVKTYLRRLRTLVRPCSVLTRIAAGQDRRNWLGYNCSIGIHAVGWRIRITTCASLVFATTAAVSGCLLSGRGGVGMQLESERAGSGFVKGAPKCSGRFGGYYELLWREIMRTPAL